MRRAIIVGMFIMLMLSLPPIHAKAQSAVSVSNDKALVKFPDTIAFGVDLKSESEITRVVLEYGVERLTCGNTVAKAFPKVTPGKDVTARWTWEMKQSGSEPPGASIWWRWHINTADGRELVTDRQKITWIDALHSWQSMSGRQATVHWYSGDKSFASELLRMADKALNRWEQTISLKPDSRIDLYIYATTQEMRDAIYYAASWTGGRAYSAQNIVIIGISPSQFEWAETSIAHELTHVLFGRYGFACIEDTPLWLTEGLAMYGQGGPSSSAVRQFNTAVASDQLMSVRAVSSNFPEDEDEANLAYSESYSLVDFLIEKYGQSKMMLLLDRLREGASSDDAIRSAFGFDVDGLEDAWRAKIGAKPRRAGVRGTPTLTPIMVPTFVPVAGLQVPTRTATPVPATATITPAPATETPIPTATPAPVPEPLVSAAAPLSVDPLMVGTAIAIALSFMVIMLTRRRKG